MIVSLAWKEYREHRSIWLTMVVLTGLLGLGLAQLADPTNPDPARVSSAALALLGMAATYGVVCGSMMFAGERESGTLVFLDIFLGRRGRLWFGKVVIGLALALSEALAVALVLYLVRQPAPLWLPFLVGRDPVLERGLTWQNPRLWFLALAAVTLEAYAWGLLGSAITRRVLSGAALAAAAAAPLWVLGIFAPPEAFLLLRLAGAVTALLASFALFQVQAWETAAAPRPAGDAHPMKRVVEEWDRGDRFDLERRAPDLAGGAPVLMEVVEPIPAAPAQPVLTPEPAPVLMEVVEPIPVRRVSRPPVARRSRRIPQARSPGEALRWLLFRQAGLPVGILSAVALAVGLLIPSQGELLWPFATLLLGVACGTAAFSQEQTDQSYQFVAAQHLPLKTFWNAKIFFWLTTAGALALLALGSGALVALVKTLDSLDPEGARFAAQFNFGTLRLLLGPALYFGVWLAYGFSVGQVFVLLCRKSILAVLIASLAAAGALALWLPSLLCGGMAGWPLWLPPLLLLAATRFLVRAWAGGRIKERRPLAALVGFGLAALAWVAVNLGVRAWEIPDVGEPLDRLAFKASIAAGRENRAGVLVQDALMEMERPEGQEGPWLPRMARAAGLPPGVIQPPASGGPTPFLRHLQFCPKLIGKLRNLSRAALADGKPGPALDHLAQLLALSRNLRNKVPVESYLVGVEAEASALEGLDEWLARGRPAPALLRRVLAELNRHAAETPPPVDCLRTECYHSGGVVETPGAWSFAPGPQARGLVPERWLAGGITLSLEMPWEYERKTRLWRAVWAGLLRGLETPYWELPDPAGPDAGELDTTRRILYGWLPARDGPGASLTAARLARLLDESWLSDGRLFPQVVPLRAATTRARWRVDSHRLAAALALYQFEKKKPARQLEDLVPGYLAKLPVDPYSGKAYRYRISRGEQIEVPADADFQGRQGPGRGMVRPGQGVLWSTGPDRADNGGLKHGGPLADENPAWRQSGLDLVTVVPSWPQ